MYIVIIKYWKGRKLWVELYWDEDSNVCRYVNNSYIVMIVKVWRECFVFFCGFVFEWIILGLFFCGGVDLKYDLLGIMWNYLFKYWNCIDVWNGRNVWVLFFCMEMWFVFVIIIEKFRVFRFFYLWKNN